MSCFVAYPWGSPQVEQTIQRAVLPALKELDWRVLDPRFFSMDGLIHESIASAIRDCDLLLADLSINNGNVVYELGLAHGWGKKTLLLSERLDAIPFDLASRYRVILYSRQVAGVAELRKKVLGELRAFEDRPRTLADPALRRYVAKRSTVSLELLAPDVEAEPSLRFAYQLTQALVRAGEMESAKLSEVRLGSLGAWISGNVESIAGLVAKILFFVPEWRLKGAQRLKIEAEAELLLARAENVRAETAEMDRESRRKDVRLLLDLVAEEGRQQPVRLTLGDRLRIEATKDQVTIGLPVETEEQ